MVNGVAGQILRIDLTTGKISKKPSAEYVRRFVGGRGVNAKLMYEEAKPAQLPFDPENPFILGAGLLAGTGALCSSKLELTTRSPERELPGLVNTAPGGHFAPEMKFAGYDNIIIVGRANKPTYIYIENDNIQLKDAKNLWGKGIFETNRIIPEELGDPDVKILAIGQAGENLVRMATVEHEERSGTALGAVFGAKHLKAVVVRGDKPIHPYDPEKMLEQNEKILEQQKTMMERDKSKKFYRGVGVEAIVEFWDMADVGVIGHWESQDPKSWREFEKTSGRKFADEYQYLYESCFGCPLGDIPIYRIPDVGTAVMRCFPYFTPWKMKVSDMKTMFEATMLGAEYGLEQGSLANTISWLMLLYEKGIISDKDTDGIPMERGSREALIQTIHKTAKREGFGDILADGPTKFAKKIGPEAEKLHMQRGGYTGLRTVDMRVVPGWALGEAIAARANSHRARPRLSINVKTQTPETVKKGKEYGEKVYGSKNALLPWEYEGKAALVIEGQIGHAFLDSLGLCLLGIAATEETLGGLNLSPYSSGRVELGLFYAATGLTWNTKDVIEFANRIINLERAFNVRDGLTRKDDTVAERFFTEPVADGPQKGKKLDKTKFEKMKDEYYQLRGWDVETGWPTRQTLMSLDLKEVADDLNKYHKLPKPKPKTD